MSANNLPQAVEDAISKHPTSEQDKDAAYWMLEGARIALSTLAPQPAEGMVDKMYEELCWHFGDQSDPETLKKIATNFAALIPVQQEQTGEELWRQIVKRIEEDFAMPEGEVKFVGGLNVHAVYETKRASALQGARTCFCMVSSQSLRPAQPGNEVAPTAFFAWLRETYDAVDTDKLGQYYALYTQSLHQ